VGPFLKVAIKRDALNQRGLFIDISESTLLVIFQPACVSSSPSGVDVFHTENRTSLICQGLTRWQRGTRQPWICTVIRRPVSLSCSKVCSCRYFTW